MGSTFTIRVWLGADTGRRPGAERAIADALAEVKRLEQLMTPYGDSSDIARLNAAAGRRSVRVDPATLDCVSRALEMSRLSQGTFDVTFHALRGLWHFDDVTRPSLPDPAEIRRRLPLIDYRRLRLDRAGGTLFLEKPGMAVHLGGIAKGYAVDRAVAVLRARGFADAIVQAGGDLMLAGSKGGQPWRAGIRDPRGPRDANLAVVPVIDHAFSTAGDYERAFLLEGVRYHHILDPKTGYPARGVRSVTLWAPDATTADGLDDAVFILGVKRGLALVERLPDVAAVIIDDGGRVHVSARLQGRVEILHPPTPGP